MVDFTEEVIVNLKDYILNLAYSKDEIDRKMTGYVTEEEFDASTTCVLTATTDLINPKHSLGTALTVTLSHALEGVKIKFFIGSGNNTLDTSDAQCIGEARTNSNGQAMITVNPTTTTSYIAQAIIYLNKYDIDTINKILEGVEDHTYSTISNGSDKVINSNVVTVQCIDLDNYITQSLTINGPSETVWGETCEYSVSLSPARENVLVKVNGEEHYTNDIGEFVFNVTPTSPGIFSIVAETPGEKIENEMNDISDTEYSGCIASMNLNVKKRAVNFTIKESLSAHLEVKVDDSQYSIVQDLPVTLQYDTNRPSVTASSDYEGLVFLYHNPILEDGTFKVNLSSPETPLYYAESTDINIKITDGPKPTPTPTPTPVDVKAKCTGIYCWSNHFTNLMKNVSSLKSKGIYNIFAHEEVYSYLKTDDGKKALTTLHNNGMKLHIWVNVFYDNTTGNWKPPKYKSGSSIKYSTHKSGDKNVSWTTYKKNLIEKYVTIKDNNNKYVDGIHLDYFRYPGAPSGMKAANVPANNNETNPVKKYNGKNQITYFAQLADKIIRSNGKAQELSCTIPPEPSALVSYYGQDVSAISQYMDFIVILAYTGDYNKNNSWITNTIRSIKKTVSTNTKTSAGKKEHKCDVWVGMQGYKSSKNTTRKTLTADLNEAKAGINGGAVGVVWHRYGITNVLDCKKYLKTGES